LAVLSTLVMYTVNAQYYRHEASWEKNVGGRITSIKTLDKSIVIGSDDNVYCYGQNGILKWSYTTNNTVNSIHTYEDKIIASSTDHFIYLLSGDGKLVWKTEIAGYVGYDDAVDARDGRILAGSVNGKTHMYDVDGKQLWEYDTEGYVMAVKIIEEDVVIVSDREVFLLDKDGAFKTKFDVGNYIRTTSIDNKSIVLGLSNGVISSYSRTGKPLWDYNTGGQIGVILAADNIVLAGLRDGRLLALHEDGGLRYTMNLSEGVVSVNTNGVYTIAGTLDNKLYLVGPTGTVNWFMEAEGRLLSVLIDSASIIAGSTTGEVYYTRPPLRTPTESFLMASTMMFIIVVAWILFIKSWERV
jgi:hypothetical protein